MAQTLDTRSAERQDTPLAGSLYAATSTPDADALGAACACGTLPAHDPAAYHSAAAYAERELAAWHAENGVGVPELRHADTAQSIALMPGEPCDVPGEPCAVCAAIGAGVVLTSGHDGREWRAELTGPDGYTIGHYAAGSYRTLAAYLVRELAGRTPALPALLVPRPSAPIIAELTIGEPKRNGFAPFVAMMTVAASTDAGWLALSAAVGDRMIAGQRSYSAPSGYRVVGELAPSAVR